MKAECTKRRNANNLHLCTGQEECKKKYQFESTICRGEMLVPLFRMSKAVTESESLSETLTVLLEILKDNMEVKKGMINLFNSKTGKIFIHDSIGLTAEEETRGVYSIGEGITGKVVETGVPIVVPRICNEPAFLNRTKSHSNTENDNLSFVCMPILRGKKILGAISVERHCSNPKSLRHDVELLSILTAMIAQAVELYLLENEQQRALKEKFHPSNIIGNSKPMLGAYTMINKIMQTKSTVLLLGESGVGKELFANAIHYNSTEANGPFIKFNCAALPESIIESELFGHEKGSFTGAEATRKGRFEEADGGTIFIDEVGELSPTMQAKLLRVLQERTFERVGGNKSIIVDIRIVAATNRDLTKMVKEGTFREDLYYRLNVFPIVIPPLRDRSSDIIVLAEYFVTHFVRKFGMETKRISTSVQKMLLAYLWPGNVRELENVIERAVILTDDDVIHGYNLPLCIQESVLTEAVAKEERVSKFDALEYNMIIVALTSHKGNMSAAAGELGLTRRMLGIRMDKFGINYKKYRHA